MLQYQFRPIEQWPGEPTKLTKPSKFRAGWTDTTKLLERELHALSARNVVIQAYVNDSQIRQDGMLYASARPSRPGVILSFESKHGPLSYPCDRYSDWQDNVRAIALSLESLRAVDRYGVTKRSEQYRGWAKLPGPTPQPAMTPRYAAGVLLKAAGLSSDGNGQLDKVDLLAVFRRASAATHPDMGGNPEEFKRVQEAKDVLDKHFRTAV